MKLIATKSFLYNTRRLLAGDVFEPAKPIHGKLLVAAKKAILQREPGKVAPPPAALKAKVVAPVVSEPAPAPVEDVLTALRAEYQEKVGKRPFMGWDAETVRAKMTEAGVADPAPPAPAEIGDTPVSSDPAPVTEDTDEDDDAS